MRIKTRFSAMTYGAEHELADIPRNKPLPSGFKWDEKDCTIVNSNGIANDPKGKLWVYGGEVNTPPTGTISAQVDHLSLLKERYPEAKVNYRSNLHVHIRVPGLRDDLGELKRFARYNLYWLPKVLPHIEPIPEPTTAEYPVQRELRGAMRRYRRRKRSHHTMLPASRVERQLAARTIDDFFKLEVPIAGDGTVLWHAQPRAAVNLRQMLQTDTVEFRHFPGTLEEEALEQCLLWCKIYIQCALGDWEQPEEVNPLLEFRPHDRNYFPGFPQYSHWHEVRYRATCHDNSVYRDTIKLHIDQIVNGSFDAEKWEATLKW